MKRIYFAPAWGLTNKEITKCYNKQNTNNARQR